MLLYPLVVRELALRLVLDVIVGCFPAIAAATSPTPVIVTLAAATDATLKALLVVSAVCAISADRSVPFKYNGPASIMLDPITAEPAISIDGAVTAQENTALPAEIPSQIGRAHV